MEKKMQKKGRNGNRKWTPASIRKVFQSLQIQEKGNAPATILPFEKFSLIKYVETVNSASNLNTRY